MRTYFVFLIPFLIFSCKPAEKVEEEVVENHLGVLEHGFNINEASQSDFEEGLLLIHSFEYDDALTAFQAAKEKDSTEVMNYWGEAMSHYKALWGLQDKRAGYAVMEALGITKEERMEKISDPLEKDFWEGLEILYGDGSLKDRNQRFNEHMGKLHDKYPDNQEASAFYALSMMWDSELDEDKQITGRKSASIAASILKENPLHPGALHYTIHAYDDPELADLAMDAANKYAKVAPDAGHALHMPSHIYLALGMWSEVSSSNEVSYEASVKRMERLELSDCARGYHAYAWLHYSYLQQGRTEEATELLAKMSNFKEDCDSKGIRSYIASMQAAQLAETNEWPSTVEKLDVKLSDLGLGSRMNYAFQNAYLGYKAGDASKIETELEVLTKEIKQAELYVSEEETKMCSAGPTRYAPNEESIKKAYAVLYEIKALKSQLINDGEYETLIQKAVEYETDAEYSFGPADISYPSFEMYGDWLLENERYEEALAQFDKSLERAPNRRKALLGRKSAAAALGKQEIVKEVDGILAGFDSSKALTSL